MYLLIRRDLEHHGVQTDVHAGLADHFDKPSRVFRSGQFFLKVMQAKAIMDALVQDTRPVPGRVRTMQIERQPASQAAFAADRPAGPPPMITSSYFMPDPLPWSFR